MKKPRRALIVIPARGGSKGIPRKNLRLLAGRPLLAHTIEIAKKIAISSLIVVTSDDEEILSIAEEHGIMTRQRGSDLAGDQVTLDPVVFDAYQNMSGHYDFEYVVTLQPTSPLLRIASFERALRKLDDDPSIDCVISVVPSRHLSWRRERDRFVPNYEERVNRQAIRPVYVETGAFVIRRARTYSNVLDRVAGRVVPYEVDAAEAVDIDSHADWVLAEYYLNRRNVLFVVAGSPTLGLGHVYRAMLVAEQLPHHRVGFLTPADSELGYTSIRDRHFDVHQQPLDQNLLEAVCDLQPDVVINDMLDTQSDYVRSLKDRGCVVINFEDLGSGAQYADLVINALYPERVSLANHYFGPAYFCARDEFRRHSQVTIRDTVEDVLVTFGGADPSGLTEKTIDAVQEVCAARGIRLTAILGLGYEGPLRYERRPGVTILHNVKNMANRMAAADVAITSAGRTVYELACLGVPSIVLAQNQRELSHVFANAANGFANLGLGSGVPPDEIARTLVTIVEDLATRRTMQERMVSHGTRDGIERVMALIRKAISRGVHK